MYNHTYECRELNKNKKKKPHQQHNHFELGHSFNLKIQKSLRGKIEKYIGFRDASKNSKIKQSTTEMICRIK